MTETMAMTVLMAAALTKNSSREIYAVTEEARVTARDLLQ
jgi:hypothetical protein